MKLEPSQFDVLIRAIEGNSWLPLVQVLIALFAAIAALASVVTAWRIYRSQQTFERRRYVAQLYEDWWSESLDHLRLVVLSERDRWQSLGDGSPAMRHFSGVSLWLDESIERRAHARILYFFSDLNRMIEHEMIDEDLALELFGLAHYDWYRGYFQAIRAAVASSLPAGSKGPRFLAETARFEHRLDRWKAKHRSS